MPPAHNGPSACIVTQCVARFRVRVSYRPFRGAIALNATMREIFWYFLKLGWLAFGGPVGQNGLMHLQVVERQKWIGEEEFVRALNFRHVLSGPEALPLAIHLGRNDGVQCGGPAR